jgi:PAS domain S-box-containing protein
VEIRETLSEDCYRKIVENTSDVIWMVSGAQGPIVFMNRDFSGARREHLIGKSPADLPIPRIPDLEALLEAFRTAATEGQSTENLHALHKNVVTGELEHYLHSIMPVRDAEGTISGVQVLSTDVTPLMRTQRLVEILNSVSVEVQHKMLSPSLLPTIGAKMQEYGIVISVLTVEEEGNARLLYTSYPRRKFRKILQLLGKEKVLGGMPLEKWGGPMQSRNRQIEFWDSPKPFLNSRVVENSHKKNLDAAAALMGNQRIIVAPIVAGRDVIGSLKVMSETLTETDLDAVKTFAAQFGHALVNSRLQQHVSRIMEYLRNVSESLDEGIFIVDDRGVVVCWNRAAQDLLGYERKDVIGMPIAALGLEKMTWEKVCQNAVAKPGSSNGRVRLKTRGAALKQFMMAAFPVDPRNGSCAGLACVIREAAQ